MKQFCTSLVIIDALLTFLIGNESNTTKLKTKLMKYRLHPDISQFRHILPIMLIVILSMAVFVSIVPFEAQAAAGSYNLKWYAADPAPNSGSFMPTYAKLTPAQLPCPGNAGRYADPLANAVAYGPTSSTLDAVTSLAPKDMALGQVVPYEMVIDVSGSTTPENGRISFTTTFDANTTSNDNFGFDPAYMVYCAFVDTADAGTNDPGNNAKVDNYTSTLIGSGSSQQIQGTFNISGLDNGDRVVVEIWVVLKSKIPTNTGGNVQTGLENAQTNNGSTINTGRQTVPLLQVGKFFTNSADVSVMKEDCPDPVVQGRFLGYCVMVKNNSPDTVANGVVVNDTLPSNVTFVSAGGAPFTINGNNISFNLGAMSPGQSTIINITTKVSDTAWPFNDTSINPEPGTPGPRPTLFDLLNIVSVTSINSDPNSVNNIYYQPTNVLPAVPAYTIDKIVTNVAGQGPNGNITQAGDVISYTVNITNTGNVNLTNVTVTDSLINLTGPILGDDSPTGILDIGETWIFTGNYTATQADINTNGNGTGFIQNTATVKSDQLDPKSHSDEVSIQARPAYTINKIVIDVAGNGSAGNVSEAGQIIRYQVNVSNVGNVDLTNVNVTDTLINLTGPTGDIPPLQILNVGETWVFTGNYTVTSADITTGGNGTGFIQNTATVKSDQLEPKSHSAEVPIKGNPGYIIDKIVTDVANEGPGGSITAAGQVISYRVNVTNTGNVNLTNVSVTDSLINLIGPIGDNVLTGVLNIGETWTFTGTYSATQEDINTNGNGTGFILNTATVNCSELEPKSHSAEVPIWARPAYTIHKIATDVAGRGPNGFVISVGDVISYQVNVSNTGNVDLINVIVTDSLINLLGPTGDIPPSQILNVGETWVFTGNYTVTSADITTGGNGTGFIQNTATVQSDQLEPKSHSVEVPLGLPAYAIDKIVTDVGGRGRAGDVTAVGDIISYRVNVTNIGNIDLININVTDTRASLIGPAGDNSPINVLNVGEIWTYTGNYTVTQADINNTVEGKGFINNTATVNSTQVPSKNDSQSVSISLPRSYNIQKIVIDVAGNGPNGSVTKAGDVIKYTVNVTNNGQVNLTNVSVTDNLINLTGPTQSLIPNNILEIGETWLYNGTYTVNQTDISTNGGGDGFIENRATVRSDQLAPKSDGTRVPIILNPALTIEKSASPENYSAVGQVITYTYNVTNSGNVNILGPINITDNRTGTSQITKNKFAYITNSGDNTVSVIDTATNNV
ncbi:MAG: beta strand repeat-containing protein, partial [Methanosarcina sp.]